MPRLTTEVVQELLNQLSCTVTSYAPEVQQTGTTIDELIAGTAVFPGGTGLWRGYGNGGALPWYFPERPLMFVAHNFGSIEAYRHARSARGEVEHSKRFWPNLLAFLLAANTEPSSCFFTNAFMGLKPGSATGPMPLCDGYKEQCLAFLLAQVQIVKPKAVVVLGRPATELWTRAGKLYSPVRSILWEVVAHPSAWPKDQTPEPETWRQNQGAKIAKLLSQTS